MSILTNTCRLVFVVILPISLLLGCERKPSQLQLVAEGVNQNGVQLHFKSLFTEIHCAWKAREDRLGVDVFVGKQVPTGEWTPIGHRKQAGIYILQIDNAAFSEQEQKLKQIWFNGKPLGEWR